MKLVPSVFGALALAALPLAAVAQPILSNTPPILGCPSPLVLECFSTNGTPGTLTADVADVDGDALHMVWMVNGRTVQTNDLAAGVTTAQTVTFAGRFRYGTNTVHVAVGDGRSEAVLCATEVVVIDTTAPVIHRMWADPNILWPPNHKLIPVRVHARVTDACGPVRCKIVWVRCNETVDERGSGHTAPDWIITGDMNLKVRSERSGRGSGRIYTIGVQCVDRVGNASMSTTRVFVPHDRRGHDDLDDDQDDDHNDRGHKGRKKAKKKGRS